MACGLSHTAVALRDGRLFTWGNGANGRLGNGSIESVKQPKLINYFFSKGLKVAAVFCGSAHTVAVLREGSLFLWGKNSRGQCGLLACEDVLLPVIVELVAVHSNENNVCQMMTVEASKFKFSVAVLCSQ